VVLKEKGAINMCTVKCKGKKVIVFHIRVWGALCEYISGMYIFIFIPEMRKRKRKMIFAILECD